MNNSALNFRSGNIARRAGALLLLFYGWAHQGPAQDRVPEFKDFPATPIYRGKNAPLILTADVRSFKTRLRAAAKERPNFAGHYIVTTWGCGTGCDSGAIIDAKTGRVYWFPFAIGQDYEAGEEFNPVEFRADSKLIIFNGVRVDRDEKGGARFYKFEDGRFILLKFIRSPKARNQ